MIRARLSRVDYLEYCRLSDMLGIARRRLLESRKRASVGYAAYAITILTIQTRSKLKPWANELLLISRMGNLERFIVSERSSGDSLVCRVGGGFNLAEWGVFGYFICE